MCFRWPWKAGGETIFGTSCRGLFWPESAGHSDPMATLGAPALTGQGGFAIARRGGFLPCLSSEVLLHARWRRRQGFPSEPIRAGPLASSAPVPAGPAASVMAATSARAGWAEDRWAFVLQTVQSGTRARLLSHRCSAGQSFPGSVCQGSPGLIRWQQLPSLSQLGWRACAQNAPPPPHPASPAAPPLPAELAGASWCSLLAQGLLPASGWTGALRVLQGSPCRG